MLIKEMFVKPIDRDFKPVIKADKINDSIILNELNEYVVTNKILNHLSTFFENYVKSIGSETENIGVWISGFFGSGKSHFLKILSYILDTSLRVNGESAADILINSGKIREKSIISNIKKSTSIQNDVILINIFSKVHEKNNILEVFYKEFNKIRGYSSQFLFLANLEKKLDDKNKYDEFKKEFYKINGKNWIDVRDDFSRISDDIVITLNNIGFMSENEATRWVENPKLDLNVTIENFSMELNDYCNKKSNNHHVVFLVDEMGQYLSNNQESISELQVIVENLSTNCKGNAWVVVTSQQEINVAMNENDFSNIQGRFETRLALSSAHVDEVIQKRILEKNEEATHSLESIFDNVEGVLKNLFSFSKSSNMKMYTNYQDFINFYPFVPYQFDLMQKSLSLIRKNSLSGRDMSEGERSMIKIFNDSLIKSENQNENFLVPFNYFFESIKNDLDFDILAIIETAEKKSSLDEFDIDVLKTLFLIKYIDSDYFHSSIDNLTILMVSNIYEDKIALKNKITDSLKKLIDETFVHKNGELYSFLSDKEQDINREIKEEFIDVSDIVLEAYNIIFEEIYNKKSFNLHNRYDFKFDRIMDNGLQNRNNKIAIRIISPFYEENDTQAILHDSTPFLISSPPNDEIIIDLRRKIDIFNEIHDILQIKSYLDKKGVDLNSKLKCEKLEEYSERFDKIKELLKKAIFDSKIQINGNTIKENVEDLLDELLTILINEINPEFKFDQQEDDFQSSEKIKDLLKEIIFDFKINNQNSIKENVQELLDELINFINEIIPEFKFEEQEYGLKTSERVKKLLKDILFVRINGRTIENVEDLLDESLTRVINEVYYKLNLLNFAPDKNDIEDAIKTDSDEELPCLGALDDMKKYISEMSDVTLDDVYSNYFEVPYGYVKDDIAWLITTLFSKKKISLIINEQELLLENEGSKAIVNFIRNYPAISSKNIILRSREEIPSRYIKTVRSIHEELFNQSINSRNEERIMLTFKQNLILENDKINKYIDCIRRNEYYPGSEILYKNKNLFDEANTISTVYNFYNYVVDNEIKFYDYYEDLEGVYKFYNGPQKAIFDESLKILRIFKENKFAIDNRELFNIHDEIHNILIDKLIFKKINKLPSLNNRFNELYNEFLEKEIKKVLNIIRNDQKYLLQSLSKNDVDLKNKIIYEYDNLEKNLRSYDNIRRIQGVVQDSVNLKNRFINDSNRNDQESIINLNNIFNEEIEILDENQMEEFLNMIRKQVENELNKKHIVKIRM